MTKIEQKFQVAANSKIGDIYGKLNSVQKQTVSLFDTDRNGILEIFVRFLSFSLLLYLCLHL